MVLLWSNIRNNLDEEKAENCFFLKNKKTQQS